MDAAWTGKIAVALNVKIPPTSRVLEKISVVPLDTHAPLTTLGILNVVRALNVKIPPTSPVLEKIFVAPLDLDIHVPLTAPEILNVAWAPNV